MSHTYYGSVSGVLHKMFKDIIHKLNYKIWIITKSRQIMSSFNCELLEHNSNFNDYKCIIKEMSLRKIQVTNSSKIDILEVLLSWMELQDTNVV